VTTWLHRIVVNACLDRMRRSKARPTVPLPEHDSAHPVEPSDPLGRRELAWEIDRALRTLPEEQRAVLVLVDVEGYPVDEVAEMLGIPSGTVKSRCARGRAKLVPLLAHLRNRDDASDVPPSGPPPTPSDGAQP
jgi:RNA polymerase sigma-70 factor (ECF subfamily)